ncbi:MAG: hypothetical protein ABI700_00520 [Chloroflexota bacterium]
MFSKRKSFLLLMAVVAIVAAGAFAVYAQDSTPSPQPPFGMMGQHGMMMGTHQMWDGDSAPMFTEIAKAFGIDEQTLASELQSGKTLAQLAQEKGIDLATVSAAAQTTMKQHLDVLVTSGVLTQAQADARLSLMQEHWAEMPMLNGTDCGMMMGMGHGGMWSDDNNTPRGRMGHGG